MSYRTGTRLKLGPMSGIGVDPYWLTVTAVAADGEVSTVDEDGYPESIPAAIWTTEYEPRVLETVEPDGNADEPPAPPEEEVEDEEPAPPIETPNAVECCPAPVAHDQTDHETTPLERLADLVNRKFNCESMARKFQNESDKLRTMIDDFLTDIAKKALLAPTPDPMTAALGQAIEEVAPQEPPAEPAEIPTPQAQAIAEGVAAQAKNALADSEYETTARLEMNRSLAEVRGISSPQAARMAEKGIKTLANFTQVVEEEPDSWFDGIKYINKAKADEIYDAVADHFARFKKKYGRE